jgi:diguanylate cyclase (GGDEF)-like protein
MRLLNNFSIKTRSYILVSLSVIVALFLSVVSNKGLNEIRVELDDLIYATNIERFTKKIILEEQRYRLNSNGSILDSDAANQAFENAKLAVNQIYQELEQAESKSDRENILKRIEETRKTTDEYRQLYLHANKLLNRLNYEADVLVQEGETITAQIQAYVEAKRLEVREELSEKTIEKINAGSNVWQYTYVTRLHEKSYLLNPDLNTLQNFRKDYAFMMSEVDRLRGMSDQDFEFEKLDAFQEAALNYEKAMLTWVAYNRDLVINVLPRMHELSNNIVLKAVSTANSSVEEMLNKRETIVYTLVVVTILTVLIGLLFGSLVARSIVSVVGTFQEGLLNFFKYLNREWKSAQPIAIESKDEIAEMATLVNENIVKIEKFLDRKNAYQEALLEWARVDYQDEEITFEKATELSAKALQVERVSIWLFNEDETQLVCQDLYLREEDKHEHGISISERDFPQYFSTLRGKNLIVTSDVRKDNRTEELVEQYFGPLNICSLLDIPIVHEGKLLGVVCHEKVDEIKEWQYDEQEFVSSVSNAISLSLEIKRRRMIQEELRVQKDKLHHQAHHDVLTELPNRMLFNDRLDHAIQQAERANTKIAVLFIDLDHFKSINDTMGHKVGDELLVEVAKRLQGQIRKSDTLSRLGGDEFTILLENVQNNENVIDVTRSLLRVMEDSVELENHSFYVTLSVGVSLYPEDGRSADELLKNADTAMYQAKDEGRNTYRFYTEAMTEKAFERISMEANFRRALKEEEFVVYYQPQVEVQTGRIMGMEALVRWQHPDLGLVSPMSFIPFAVDTGLIIPLDRWVMTTAMKQCARWNQQGLNPGKLALNLSMKQLHKEDCVRALQGLISEAGCNPEWLELEVTEAQVMEDTETVNSTLRVIRDMGVSLAIDDFGTGYSSLSYLKKLPINKLKIDKSFVQDIPGDEEDVAIIRTIIALANNMELSLIAEGVETEEQKEFLVSNGCDVIQGYYYHRPMPAEELEKLLRDA